MFDRYIISIFNKDFDGNKMFFVQVNLYKTMFKFFIIREGYFKLYYCESLYLKKL